MKKQHMKLSDVEATTSYLIPRTETNFQRAYPMIDKLRMEIRAFGEGFEPYGNQPEWVEVYDQSSMRATFDCRNPRCYSGGVNLDYLLRWEVVERRLTEYERTVHCKGYEGSPKGKKKYGDCDTYFKVKITVKYEE